VVGTTQVKCSKIVHGSLQHAAVYRNPPNSRIGQNHRAPNKLKRVSRGCGQINHFVYRDVRHRVRRGIATTP
jgi:hypothetical protein